MAKKVSDAEIDIDQMSGFFQVSPEMKEQISQLDLRWQFCALSVSLMRCASGCGSCSCTPGKRNWRGIAAGRVCAWWCGFLSDCVVWIGAVPRASTLAPSVMGRQSQTESIWLGNELQ